MLKTVNLEEGMPLVDAAIRRATFELKSGRRMGLTAIKFIHGYGSSGNGGRIRVELQKYLTRLQNKREIRLFVPGERFEIFDQDTQKLLSACRELSRDKDLNRHNNGITVVLL
ncbi:MAG TPA: hypothetical protein IAA65_03870 [Candidatus Galloscillospira excrementipullorum]|nr:hypothetical protein [Candidatus Galloscillospira excrementipullorum]